MMRAAVGLFFLWLWMRRPAGDEKDPPADGKTAAEPKTMLSDHFAWQEFFRPDDRTAPPDVLDGYTKLADKLEIIRSFIGDKPIVITPHGGWQPSDLGPSQGWPKRTKNSRHRTPSAREPEYRSGVAADFYVPDMPVDDLYDAIRVLQANSAIPKGGLGFYPSQGFIHYDTRKKPAAWTGGKDFMHKEGD